VRGGDEKWRYVICSVVRKSLASSPSQVMAIEGSEQQTSSTPASIPLG